ncbi:hypothetical protein ASC83_22525 [Acidovorax sp. Root402]|nr:hypothetical protein ASC83_22525 [Acidovorax sp. Root402]
MLLHDATLDRTTNGKGTLSQLRYSEVKGFKLRSRDGGDGKTSTFLKLPTLAGALEVARDQVVLNIDVKDPSLMNIVAQIVIAAGMADQVFIKAKIQSQSDISMVRSSPFFGRVAFVPIIRARSGFFAKDLQALEPLRSLMYEVEFTEVETLEEGGEELRRQHARLWVNTIDCSHSLDFNDHRALIDPDAVWGRLLQVGVGAIQTDHTAKLVEYLKFTGRRD